MQRARPLSVLIVEDDRDGAETLAVLLETYGYRVRTAPNGDAALAVSRAFPPDAVILDLGLPGMDGFTVAEELRGILERRPLFIALSGFTNLQKECSKSGMDHYLLKPVDPHLLDDLLKSYAESSRAPDRRVPAVA